MRVHALQAYRKMDVTRERISCILDLRDALEDHEGAGGRTITNLHFADDMELAKLVECLNKASTVYSMRSVLRRPS